MFVIISLEYFSRLYSTHKSDKDFRRIICYLTTLNNVVHSEANQFPIFLQYVGYPSNLVGTKSLLKPHGNAKKTTRPFTSSSPSVLADIRVISFVAISTSSHDLPLQSHSRLEKPAEIYGNSIRNVIDANHPSKSIVRDRTQIYNARRTNLSLNNEYLTVMKLLEDTNSVISRF